MAENRSLKERQDSLIADRATLLQKNEQVRARVEAVAQACKNDKDDRVNKLTIIAVSMLRRFETESACAKDGKTSSYC